MSPFPFGSHTDAGSDSEHCMHTRRAHSRGPDGWNSSSLPHHSPQSCPFPSSCLSAWKYKGGKAGTSCQDHGRAWQIAADMPAAGSSMWLAHGDTLGWAGEGTAATSLLSSSQTLLAQDSALEQDPGSLLPPHSGSSGGSSSSALGRQLPTRLLLPLLHLGALTYLQPVLQPGACSGRCFLHSAMVQMGN